MPDQMIDLELPVPPEALLMGGKEVLRAFIVADDLHVSLANAFEQPEIWGVLLADIARHVTDMYVAKAGLPREETLAKIRKSLDEEWAGQSPAPSSDFTN